MTIIQRRVQRARAIYDCHTNQFSVNLGLRELVEWTAITF